MKLTNRPYSKRLLIAAGLLLMIFIVQQSCTKIDSTRARPEIITAEEFLKSSKADDKALQLIISDFRIHLSDKDFIPEFAKANGLPQWDAGIKLMTGKAAFIYLIPVRQQGTGALASFFAVKSGNGNLHYRIFRKGIFASTDSITGISYPLAQQMLAALRQEEGDNAALPQGFRIHDAGAAPGLIGSTASLEGDNDCMEHWWEQQDEPGGPWYQTGPIWETGNCNNTGDNNPCNWSSSQMPCGGTGIPQPPVWYLEGGTGVGGPLGYANQKIIDSLTGYPCAQSVLAALPNVNVQVKLYFQVFSV